MSRVSMGGHYVTTRARVAAPMIDSYVSAGAARARNVGSYISSDSCSPASVGCYVSPRAAFRPSR